MNATVTALIHVLRETGTELAAEVRDPFGSPMPLAAPSLGDPGTPARRYAPNPAALLHVYAPSLGDPGTPGRRY